MCKKLLCVVAFLSISSFAYAETVIDDFEPYFDDASLHTGWTETIPVVQRNLMTVGAGQGYQAMDVGWAVPGGWVYPEDPTNFDSKEISSVTRTFAPLDFQPGGELRIMLKAEGGQDLSQIRWISITLDGDTHSESLILGDVTLGWIGWSPDITPENTPATIGNHEIWPLPPLGWREVPRITPEKGWMDIVLTEDKFAPWSGIPQWSMNSLADFDAMTSISLWLVSGVSEDTTGASGNAKTDSTGGLHWPAGPLPVSVDVDYIRYIPEPATIALLGLGGLALLRRKK